MSQKTQKAREAIQTVLTKQKIFARPKIASEVQSAFERGAIFNYRRDLGRFKEGGILED